MLCGLLLLLVNEREHEEPASRYLGHIQTKYFTVVPSIRTSASRYDRLIS